MSALQELVRNGGKGKLTEAQLDQLIKGWYYSFNNETPRMIATKLEIDVVVVTALNSRHLSDVHLTPI